MPRGVNDASARLLRLFPPLPPRLGEGLKEGGIGAFIERPGEKEDEFYRPNEISQTIKNLGEGVEINKRPW